MPEPTKTLIIAEKPSVAQDLARVLGRVKKQGDYYENDEWIIASAVGHLVELFMPEDIDKKAYGFWRLGALPIIPDKFQLKPIDDKRSRERLDGLKKLLKRKDVGEVWNACDAGREGELIFTYIYELAKCKKPFRRIWMQSMTPDAIRTAFANPRDPEQMAGLADAARSRSEADWLIGINGTRAITKRMFGRSKGVATVGRVQTPTLSIVYERELAIRNFKTRPYWRIQGEFAVLAGTYPGLLQRPEPVDKKDSDDKPDRFWKEADANAALALLEKARFASASEEKKRTRQSSPRLYDLTSLQREANGRYGLPAGRTLQLAQALYEKHKVLTYPRTDSRALPEDYISTVKDTLRKTEGAMAEHAQRVLQNDWVKPSKRIFNNAQISDHFAIIPTGEVPNKLTADEEKIFDMVQRRFIAVFHPPSEFDVTTRTTRIEEFRFLSEGKVLIKEGWLAVYGKAQKAADLPPLQAEDKQPGWLNGITPTPQLAAESTHFAQPTAIHLQEDSTKPPPHFTEATLLTAMETAGKLVDDEDLADAMKEKGLGTPATRASIIDHLLREKYLEREGRSLLTTTKAENLFEFLSAIQADVLTQPDLTGEWEYKLKQVEESRLSRKDFISGITELTRSIVDRTRNFEESKEDAPLSSIISPSDNQPMRELLRAYESQDGVFTVYKTIGNRRMQPDEIQKLLNERSVGPIDGFRSKAGKPFSAILRLDPMNKVSFDFGSDEDSPGEDENLNLSELPVVGVWKETGEKVYATPRAYACGANLRNEPGDTFRISRTMLGKTLPEEEISRILEDGKTGLIKGFKSKRTGRLFDAFLVLKPKGKIGFEFPPRPPGKAAAKKAASKAAAKKVSGESN